MELAERHGVLANCRFLFPNSFIGMISETLLDIPAKDLLFERSVMLWRIMNLLPELLTDARFSTIREYLADDFNGMKLYQLSDRIAHIFDQYQMYRPDMILEWDEASAIDGKLSVDAKDLWQPALWKRLTEADCAHRAKTLSLITGMLKKGGSENIRNLPERVSIFGLSILPPVYVSLFRELSGHCDVSFYTVSPSKDYGKGKDADDILNPIYASQGKLGRDFLDLLLEDEPSIEVHEVFDDIKTESFLGSVQSGVLSDADIRPSAPSYLNDGTIQVHSCHSAMREAEVLFDSLLRMFEEDKTLKPRDILVLTPDIGGYAPYIRAVFDNPYSENHYIPYGIAGGFSSGEGDATRAFFAMLDLLQGRFKAPEMIELLECRAVRDASGFSEEDMDLLKRWIDEAGIRWGMDLEGIVEDGLPPYDQNTWKAGLKRLLLGCALPNKGYALFEDIYAYGNIEGKETRVLGLLMDFTERLFFFSRAWKGSFSAEGWGKKLTQLLATFFSSEGDYASEYLVLQQAIGEFGDHLQSAGFNGDITLEVVSYHLSHSIENGFSRHGYLQGGVTFGPLMELRGIPARVICLIGMNDGVFPRQERNPDFDIIGRSPRKGDRSLRDNDRYLFLESLISARKKLYISYVGQNIRDNTAIPPSVLVSELIEHITAHFEADKGRDVITKHRLQPFNPVYFAKGSPLFSYAGENCDTASGLIRERSEPPVFITGAISDPPSTTQQVSLSSFLRFFKHPVKYFYNERMKIYLDEKDSAVKDTELIALDNLELYKLNEGLIEGIASGEDTAQYLEVLAASGGLPHGNAGKYLGYAKTKENEEFLLGIKQYTANPLPSLPFEVDTGNVVIRGELGDLFREHQFCYRPAKVKAKDVITTWICHLLLLVSRKEGYPEKTCYMGTGEAKDNFHFGYVGNAMEILAKLSGLYLEGLTRPLHLFPSSSRDFAWAYFRSKTPRDEEKALNKAMGTWKGFVFSESDDAYYRHCFRDTDVFDDDFVRLSIAVFEDMLDYYAGSI